MKNLCRWTLLLLLGGMLPLWGCIFDKTGLAPATADGPGRDQPMIQPERGPDAPGDAAGERGGDRGLEGGIDLRPDLRLDPECSSTAAGFVCRLEAGDAGIGSPGQSGQCHAGEFTFLRHCFAEAPCFKGLCVPQGCTDCWNTPCAVAGQTCSLFLDTSSQFRACCVGKSPAGTALLGAACGGNGDCVNQLCTTDTKVCTEPCHLANPWRCPEGYACSSVNVYIGNGSPSTWGCVKMKPDAGFPDVGPLDMGPPDVTSPADSSASE